jgi:peptide deformylase
MVANAATAFGVGIAAWQLRVSRRQAVTTFEDSVAREYRELAAELPIKVFLDDGSLSDKEYRKAFDKFRKPQPVEVVL